MARLQTSYRYLFLLIVTLICSIVQAHAQSPLIYVNQNASGANDGSSWTDAYRNLHDALIVFDAEIWVAAGTYTPSFVDSSVAFTVKGTQQIYGGFAGNETIRSQRDFTLNQTILSGDIGQDDLMSPADNHTQLVGINSINVIRYQATSISDITLDGLIITAGLNTTNNGAGILVYETNPSQISMTIRNCQMTGNVAVHGGALNVYCDGCTQNIIVKDCEFGGNAANGIPKGYGGAISFSGNNGTVFNNHIRRSLFEDNQANWQGGAISFFGNQYTDNSILDSCYFSTNKAGGLNGGFGGALGFSSEKSILNVQVLNSNFIGNEAESFNPSLLTNEGGGAIEVRSYNLVDISSFSLAHCYFDNNQIKQEGTGACLDFGITQESANSNPTALLKLGVKDCRFTNNGLNNGKPNPGGAFYLQAVHADVDLDIQTSHFFNNNAYQGGAVLLYTINQSDLDIKVKQSLFEYNNAELEGGGIFVINNPQSFPNNVYAEIEQNAFIGNNGQRGGAIVANTIGGSGGDFDFAFKQNRFEDNSALITGGAISSRTTFANQALHFAQDTFINNQATNRGGAIFALPCCGGSFKWDMDQAYLSENQAPYGGAISVTGDIQTPSLINTRNSVFERNNAQRGGSIYFKEMFGSIQLENLLMTENEASNSGGALYITSTGSLSTSVTGCTFSKNKSQDGGDAIYLNTTNSSPFNFNTVNSIYWDNDLVGDDILVDGNVMPSYSFSLFEEQLAGAGILSVDPNFINSSNGNYQLDWSSPAVDGGSNAQITTALDLAGNTRIQGLKADIGVYESPFTTPIESPSLARLDFYPNPSKGQIQLSLPPTQGDDVKVLLYDPLGRLVFEDRFAERSSSTLALDFGSLSAGVYLLSVQAGGQAFSESLIIQ